MQKEFEKLLDFADLLKQNNYDENLQMVSSVIYDTIEDAVNSSDVKFFGQPHAWKYLCDVFLTLKIILPNIVQKFSLSKKLTLELEKSLDGKIALIGSEMLKAKIDEKVISLSTQKDVMNAISARLANLK